MNCIQFSIFLPGMLNGRFPLRMKIGTFLYRLVVCENCHRNSWFPYIVLFFAKNHLCKNGDLPSTLSCFPSLFFLVKIFDFLQFPTKYWICWESPPNEIAIFHVFFVFHHVFPSISLQNLPVSPRICAKSRPQGDPDAIPKDRFVARRLAAVSGAAALARRIKALGRRWALPREEGYPSPGPRRLGGWCMLV